MKNKDQLRKSVERQVKRMQRAEKERPTMWAQSVFLGTLSFLLVLPVIGGAYLGNWLDEKAEGYSDIWTISFIILGLVVGIFNVYLYIRERF